MIGSRLREARKKEELTLNELAKITGFSPSYISQVERGLTEPSITSLRRFCLVLDKKMYFFLEEDASDPVIVRKHNRQKLKISSSNVVYEFVSPMMRQAPIVPKFEVIEVTVSPKKYSSEESYSHNVDEIIMVLEGTLSIIFNEKEVTLKKGDSIYLAPNTSQRLFNPSDEILVFLSIMTPAIY